MNLDQYNSFTFIFDINKLLVPTPPIYARDLDGTIIRDSNDNPTISSGKDPNRPFISGTFGSFNDAPNGFSEEMQELTFSVGTEYWYGEMVAARIGYFYEHENKGARKYFTVGFGVRYSTFGLDLSYLIPQEQNNPLGDTLRLSFLFNFNKKETLDISS